VTVTAGSGRPLLLRNVTIVDTRDGALTPNADVRVGDGVIASITTADPHAADAADASLTAAEVVDGSGKYLIPGYLDMHAHPLTEKHRPATWSSCSPTASPGFAR
jgi:N-acyl-D-aspartate/D-glutamate deacylase